MILTHELALAMSIWDEDLCFFISAITFLISDIFFAYNFSIISLFPAFAVLIFLFLILKISTRENIKELNNSLESIDTIDILNGSNSRQKV